MRQASRSQRHVDGGQACRHRGLGRTQWQVDGITQDPGNQEAKGFSGASPRVIALVGTLKNPNGPFDTQFDLARGAIVQTVYGPNL
ncbi:hypothetical protein GCM10027021_18680 [Dyella kyungheensis]